ncbi:hypothetical protein O3Q52_46300 [Streptomyces sp. ActVer]|uniref:hypothetical protein n=1 Tax=Streptomyces sp. ActVer TaxID=3014558 RepID=UPI0022B3F5DC|nr:hypothetical protein [Streptomyces sp. ActVer]MCZ4515406.1 hypothetical protein [Streptomyces sp. ActVer]
MKICGRCDQSIQGRQKYTTHDIPSPSGPGATVYLHVAPCKRVPTQTTQDSLYH